MHSCTRSSFPFSFNLSLKYHEELWNLRFGGKKDHWKSFLASTLSLEHTHTLTHTHSHFSSSPWKTSIWMESNTHLALKAKVKIPQALSFEKKDLSEKKLERNRKKCRSFKMREKFTPNCISDIWCYLNLLNWSERGGKKLFLNLYSDTHTSHTHSHSLLLTLSYTHTHTHTYTYIHIRSIYKTFKRLCSSVGPTKALKKKMNW